jgi:hypothetical protein
MMVFYTEFTESGQKRFHPTPDLKAVLRQDRIVAKRSAGVWLVEQGAAALESVDTSLNSRRRKRLFEGARRTLAKQRPYFPLLMVLLCHAYRPLPLFSFSRLTPTTHKSLITYRLNKTWYGLVWVVLG